MLTALNIIIFIVILVTSITGILEYNKMKKDLIMYQDAYLKDTNNTKNEIIEYKTIKEIKKKTRMEILTEINMIIEQLMIRIPKILRTGQVCQIDKKYLLDLIFLLGARFSNVDFIEDKLPNYIKIKFNKELSLKEACKYLLDMFSESIIFSLKDIDKYPVSDIEDELSNFILYSLIIILKEKK